MSLRNCFTEYGYLNCRVCSLMWEPEVWVNVSWDDWEGQARQVMSTQETKAVFKFIIYLLIYWVILKPQHGWYAFWWAEKKHENL